MIYINKNNQQIGPFDRNKVWQMLNNYQLSPHDIARREGSSEWKPLMLIIDEGHPSLAIIERESQLYDVYSDEMRAISQQLAEVDDRTAKVLKRQYEQKLQIAERHVYSLKQQYSDVFEVRIMEADLFFSKAVLKINERGFFNSASGSLLARGRQKSSLTSLSLAAATRMVANQQEKNNAIEAIHLLEQSINLFDTPGARYAKAYIFHSLKEDAFALQELNWIISNFQNDEMYIPARQLKDEIENPPKKGVCFVATAVYGSPLAPEVEIFRQFRDETLLKSKIGEAFVEFYYLFSPPIAGFIARWSFLRVLIGILFLNPTLKLLRSRKFKT